MRVEGIPNPLISHNGPGPVIAPRAQRAIFLTFFSDFQGKTEHFCVRREDPEPINCTQRTRTYCLHLRAQRAIFFVALFAIFKGKHVFFCA